MMMKITLVIVLITIRSIKRDDHDQGIFLRVQSSYSINNNNNNNDNNNNNSNYNNNIIKLYLRSATSAVQNIRINLIN